MSIIIKNQTIEYKELKKIIDKRNKNGMLDGLVFKNNKVKDCPLSVPWIRQNGDDIYFFGIKVKNGKFINNGFILEKFSTH